MSESDLYLTVNHVSKRFNDVTAVGDLSFDVRRGEVFALLGPNGAGKTTTVRMLVGVIRPDEGEVSFRLSPLDAEDARDRLHSRPNTASSRPPPPSHVGYLAEESGLHADVAVLRTLCYVGVLRGLSRSDARRATEHWLDRLGLADRARSPLEALSKGNRQKVQVISAILHRPKLAILDEPFSGLDPVNQDLLIDLIRELRDDGMTILLSAHQMDLVERLADRILLMGAGRRLLYGTLREVLDQASVGDRLAVETATDVDLVALRKIPLVERVESAGAGRITIYLRERAPLNDVLKTLERTTSILSVQSHRPSLHEAYVRAVAQDLAGHPWSGIPKANAMPDSSGAP